MSYMKQLMRRSITWGLIAISSIIGALFVIQDIPSGLLSTVDLLLIPVSAVMTDGSAENVDAIVTTPLERTLRKIAGVTETTSVNVHSTTRISLQCHPYLSPSRL